MVLWPLGLRVALMGYHETAPAIVDLRGIGVDVAIGFVIAMLGWWCLQLGTAGRVLATVLAIAWIFVNLGLYEFALVFEGVDALRQANYLFDPTFFRGSVLTPKLVSLLLGASLIAGISIWWRQRVRPRRRMLIGSTSIAFVVLALSSLWPLDPDQTAWRQRNLVLANLSMLLPSGGDTATPLLDELDATTAKLFRPDLDGIPIIEPVANVNVLLVILEGISGAYLPSVAAALGFEYDVKMTHLDQIAHTGLSWTTMVTHQHQTNRGEYAILCGDYPKLDHTQAKMSEYVFGGRRRCLPQILADAGWQTAYLQAAPLAFMYKDQFMPQIGFEQVYGDTWFKGSYARSRWGVDDRTFLEQSIQLVRTLNAADKPWFLTMLTVGTHHPFIVPDNFKAPGERQDPHTRAVAWLDQAVSEFFDALQAEGILENTLLILTSDESAGFKHGFNYTTRLLSRNWGFLTVLAPGVTAAVTDTIVVQSDLALSVLDYLALADSGTHLVGRSVFRRYDRPRPVVFANIFTNKVFGMDVHGVLSSCVMDQLSTCNSFQSKHKRLFSASYVQSPSDPARLAMIRQAVAEAGRPAAMGTRISRLIEAEYVDVFDGAGQQIVFGGQYLTVKENTRINVALTIEAQGEKGRIELLHFIRSSQQRNRSSQQRKLHPSWKAELQSGDTLSLNYTATLREAHHRLLFVLRARNLQGKKMKLRIKEAQTTFSSAKPGAPEKTEVQVHRFQIVRASK